MSGTLMIKKGTGWMKLNTNNAALTRMVIAAGTVQCINAATPAKTVEYQGGTLRENTSTSYAIYIPKGKSGTWYMANRSTYSNRVTGEGTLNAYCVTEKGTNYYATRTPVKCNFSQFEGTLKPSSSVDDPNCLRFTLDSSTGMPLGTMNLADKVEVQNTGKTYHIGKVTGTGALGGSCTFSNGASVGANTWKVGNDTNWSTTARIVSNANFEKVGQGKITWNGASTNTGTTSIVEGELSLGTSSSLGTGALTVSADATLSGSNSVKSPIANSKITINGLLRPGVLATGTLYFDSKPVTITTDGTLHINAAKCATATANGCTAIEGISSLTINGTIRIALSNTSTLQPGDSIRIFRASNVYGTPRFEFTGNALWDTSRFREGILYLTKLIATGDVNQDGTVDVADIAAVIDTMAGSTEYPFESADVNGDGAVDVADISSIITIMAENSRRLTQR